MREQTFSLNHSLIHSKPFRHPDKSIGQLLRRRIQNGFVLLCGLVLSACGSGGGDGDSSSGAGSSSGGSTVDLAQFAGTYEGTVTAIVNVDNATETLTRSVTFVIAPDGNMITIETQTFPLMSDTFELMVALPLSQDDVVCTLEATINGNIMEDLISGTVSGSGNCVRDGITFPAELSGYSGATRVSA